MKPFVALALLFIAGRLLADTTPATTTAAATPTTATTPVAKPGQTVKTPAVPGAKVDPAKKKDEMGVIKGMTIARANGTFLGLEVINANFVLSFYDKKKKPMAMDATRATARWPNTRGPGDNRTVLNGSGTKLVGAKPVVPPYAWNVYITLLQGEGENEKAFESFVIPFRG